MELKNSENKSMVKSSLLNNLEVIRWCYEPVTKLSLRDTQSEKKLKDSKSIEKEWGNGVMNTVDGKQWTTTLCQNLVLEALIKLGRNNVKKTKPCKSSVNNKKYEPDLECDEYVYEVKGRSWCTPGTAGEKILGVPLKYGELPSLYHKPLRIILVGYQEYEARNGYGFGDLLDKNVQTKELHDSLKYFKDHKIEYIGFTDILKQIGLDYDCWNKK